MFDISSLDVLLVNLLKEVPNLVAALIIDQEGLIIAQQSVKGFNEEIIGAIMSIIDETIKKIKKFTKTSFGSGTFDSEEFRLFYLELGGIHPVIFVLVGAPYADFEKLLPYAYITAEKVSSILNNRETSLVIPNLLKTTTGGKYGGQNIFIKIVIIGDNEVGKSSFVDLYMNGNFANKDYKPTIGVAIAEKEVQISNRLKVTYALFDMAGSKGFANVRRYFYKDTKAVLILFDYSKAKTLESLPEWIEEVHHFAKSNSIPFILVGNKIDLIEARENIKKRAEDMAKKFDCFFFETSAMTGEGIDELFTSLITNLS